MGSVVWIWDASDYDWDRGPMDLAAARRDGIQVFTHKATEGTHIQHVHYGEALNRARAAGMPCMGAYMVPRTPGNNGHGTIPQQVSYFLAYLDQQTPWWRSTPEFFIQVDTEHWGYDDVAPELGAQACTLLRAETGKWVIHYAPRWAYGDTIPGDDPLWASSYGTNPAVPYRQAYPGDDAPGWAPYSGRVPTFLQYGSRLTIGSQPDCDANAFRGTVDQLRALITGDSMLKDESITIPSVDGKGTETRTGDMWLAYACRDAYLGWQTAAAAKTAVDALTVKLDALAKLVTDGSGNPDLAGALAHFDAGIADLKAQESATVQAMQARIDRLQAALAAAEQAAAGALTPPAAA